MGGRSEPAAWSQHHFLATLENQHFLLHAPITAERILIYFPPWLRISILQHEILCENQSWIHFSSPHSHYHNKVASHFLRWLHVETGPKTDAALLAAAAAGIKCQHGAKTKHNLIFLLNINVSFADTDESGGSSRRLWINWLVPAADWHLFWFAASSSFLFKSPFSIGAVPQWRTQRVPSDKWHLAQSTEQTQRQFAELFG